MAKRRHSSKRRGATALPSTSGARAMLMSGIHNPAAVGAVMGGSATNLGQPSAPQHDSPLMGKAKGEEAHDEALASDSPTAGSQPQLNLQGRQSLQMVQTKQDREKRTTDPFYETQNLPAYGQPRVRIAGASPAKPGKKMSLSQLKNRKLNKFPGGTYGLRSQSPGRSPSKPGVGAGSDSGRGQGPIDIDD